MVEVAKVATAMVEEVEGADQKPVPDIRVTVPSPILEIPASLFVPLEETMSLSVRYVIVMIVLNRCLGQWFLTRIYRGTMTLY
jgi:hypothetical protein